VCGACMHSHTPLPVTPASLPTDRPPRTLRGKDLFSLGSIDIPSIVPRVERTVVMGHVNSAHQEAKPRLHLRGGPHHGHKLQQVLCHGEGQTGVRGQRAVPPPRTRHGCMGIHHLYYRRYFSVNFMMTMSQSRLLQQISPFFSPPPTFPKRVDRPLQLPLLLQPTRHNTSDQPDGVHTEHKKAQHALPRHHHSQRVPQGGTGHDP
jgi:hypothetical protein